jgi:hypothetical protein
MKPCSVDKKYKEDERGNPFHDPVDKYIGKIKVIGNDTPHFFIITHPPAIIPKEKGKNEDGN